MRRLQAQCDASDAPRRVHLAAPCVAIHVEQSQLQRFAVRIESLAQLRPFPSAWRVVAVSSPLIYVQTPVGADATAAELLAALASGLGSGRIAPHRLYQLDWSCADPQWILHADAIRCLQASGDSVVLRVTAYPRHLQAKMAALLASHGLRTHPTQHTHELFVVAQPDVSSLFFFGLQPRRASPARSRNNSASTLGYLAQADMRLNVPLTAAQAPCRAYFKMQESLRHLPHRIALGAHALDVGASPGGWTECLLTHGARVVAVDPGALRIATQDRPVLHLTKLLEDAMPELLAMERFMLCVCDINVRVGVMAELMLRVAPLLLPDAQVVFTLKLGKRPTTDAVARAYAQVQQILAPALTEFRLLWLHANTQNERTLLARKRSIRAA